MFKFALPLAFLVLIGCTNGNFTGSPHGYAIVGSGSVTGISVGVDPASGLPSITLGNREGRFAAWPMLDGEGKPYDVASIMACFETEAGTGAQIMSSIAVSGAAEEGCK